MFVEEKKKEFKKKILSAYIFSKPDTQFAQVIDKLGLEVGIILVDEFWGQVIVVPSRNSLQRSALPQIIRDELEGLKPDSDQFKLKIKSLANFYRLPKKAILKMNESGVYTR